MKCTQTCEQGRKCTCRLYTINTESDAPRQWLHGVVLTAVYAVSIVATTIIFAGFAGYFWG